LSRIESALPRLAFRLPLDPARLLRARQRIRDYLNEQSLDADAIDQVVLAIEEAMTNAVRHSGAVHDLEVDLRFSGADLLAEVRDQGKGFDTATFDPKHLPDPLATSGRGLYMISRLTDQLELHRNRGLHVRMVKRRVLGARRGAAQTVMPGSQAHRDPRQQAMLDELPELYAALDWEYRYLHVNERFCQTFGRSPESLLGNTVWEVFPDVVGTHVEARLREAMNLGLPSVREFFLESRGRWFEQRLYPTGYGLSQFLVEIDDRKAKDVALATALEHEAALREIAVISASSFGEADLAQRQAEAVMGLLKARAVFLWKLDDSGRLLVPSGSAGALPEVVARTYGPVSIDQDNPTSNVFRSRRPTLLEDSEADPGLPEHLKKLRRAVGYRSGVALPLLVRGEPIGCLSVAWAEPRVFSDDEIQLLETLAGEVAIGLHNNRLMDGLQASNEELASSLEALGSAHDALHEGEARVRAILDSLLDPHVLLQAVRDQKGHIVDFVFADANPAACEFNGLACEELIGTPLLGLHPAAGTTALFDSYVKLVETGEPLVLDDWSYPQDLLDGEVRRYDVRAVRVGDGLTQTWRDVTERGRAEQALRESEERHRLLFEAMQDGYAYCRMLYEDGRPVDFVYLAVNQAFETLTGLRDVVGRKASEVIPGIRRDNPELFESYGRVASGGAPESFETYLPALDIWFSISVYRPAEGHFVAVFDNITERRRSEEALRESEAHLSALTSASSDVLYRMSPDWTEMRELRGGDFLADTVQPDRHWRAKYIHPDDQASVDAIIDEAIQAKSPFRLEHRVLRKDGRLGWTSSSAVPVVGDQGEILEWFGAAHDITARKRAEEALQESRRLSEALNDINSLIHSTLSVEEIMQAVVAEAREAVGSDSAVVAVRHGEQWVAEYGDPPVPGVIRERVSIDEVPFIQTAIEQRAPVAIDDCESDVRCWPDVQRRFGVRSVLCIPLLTRDEILGVILFNRHTQAAPFLPDTIDFAGKLSSAISSALENARIYEAQRDIAVRLQETFVHPLPQVIGWQLGSARQSAREVELVGGDLGDAFTTPDGHLLVLVADVEGKGLRAAGLTQTVRSAARALGLSAYSPHYVLSRLNRLLLQQDDLFVTALLVAVHMPSGSYVISSAGHPGPVRLHTDGAEPVVLNPGLPLGTFEYDTFETTRGWLGHGESLLLYTDGVTDVRRRGHFFGERGILSAVSDCPGLIAQEIADRLHRSVVDYADEVRDDVQIIVVRRE